MSWSCTSAAWERVSPGWTANEWGYYYPDQEAARIKRALTGNRKIGEHWHEMYEEARDDALNASEVLQGHVQNLVEHLTSEREATDEVVEMAVKSQRDFGVGLFGGYGFSSHGFNPTIGAGIVWRIW